MNKQYEYETTIDIDELDDDANIRFLSDALNHNLVVMFSGSGGSSVVGSRDDIIDWLNDNCANDNYCVPYEIYPYDVTTS